jgi:hypothetical protein
MERSNRDTNKATGIAISAQRSYSPEPVFYQHFHNCSTFAKIDIYLSIA